jgi:hypothetical protein
MTLVGAEQVISPDGLQQPLSSTMHVYGIEVEDPSLAMTVRRLLTFGFASLVPFALFILVFVEQYWKTLIGNCEKDSFKGAACDLLIPVAWAALFVGSMFFAGQVCAVVRLRNGLKRGLDSEACLQAFSCCSCVTILIELCMAFVSIFVWVFGDSTVGALYEICALLGIILLSCALCWSRRLRRELQHGAVLFHTTASAQQSAGAIQSTAPPLAVAV